MNESIIKALTPIFIATIGGIIGIAVLISPHLSSAERAAGFGLSSTAIAGASGLAQNNKEVISSENKGN